jgi:hypothetical protein
MTYKEIYLMAGRNDITGDRLINKVLTKEGEENWDRIFKKKKETLPEYELDKSTGEVVKVDSKKLTDAFNGH